MESLVLAGDRVRLEPLDLSHVPDLCEAAAQDRSFHRWSFVPEGEAAMTRYVTDAQAQRAAGRESPDTGEIGFTWLGASAIGSGVNRESKRLLLTHAFETWGVQRICFHTDARNERSAEALEGIGARYEGLLRSHRLATDLRARDSKRYSIIAPEWPEIKARLAALLEGRAS